MFERLSVKAPLDVTNRHVGALLESMGRDAQVEIVFTEAALAGKSAEELTIQNLKFDAPMSYRQSIELIARISGLEWEVHGGRAVIRAAGEKLSDATKLVSCADAANRSAR